MSERDSYPTGVPCWIETLQDDAQASRGFYAGLFGWDLVDSGADPADGYSYAVARLRGLDVAGIGSPSAPDGADPAWITHVRVDSAETAAERVRAAGGSVLDAAVDADPAGRFSVLADPAGAVFCAWEPGIRDGAQLVNEPGAWAMSALQTADPDGAAAFYGAVFGWEAEAYGPVRLLRRPGYVGGTPEQPVPRDVVAVLAPLAEGGGRPRWDVDFWVGDADAAARRAVELGGRVVVAPHDRPPFRSAVLADPGGAAFSVSRLAAG